MKAMVLAAGEGTRLRPLTRRLPKPMVPIVGQPLLARTLHWLAEQGVTEAAINLYHRPQVILDYFGQEFAGIRLHYFLEEVLRGTAGGLKAAQAVFQDAPFFVIYGDNLYQADLRRLADFHAAHGGAATLALFHHPQPTAAGIVAMTAEGRITRFVEKPPADEVFSDLANAGVYVLNPDVMNRIPEGVAYDFGRDLFPLLLADDVPLYGSLLDGYLQDTGTPEAYRQANWDALTGLIGVPFPDPRLWIAPTARIGQDVTFHSRNIIGEDVVIGDRASLTDCIVWDGATIASGAHLERVVLISGVTISSKQQVEAGSLLAE